MSDQFRSQMVARGTGQMVAELYGHLHAVNALLAEGISNEDFELVKAELDKRSIGKGDLHNVVVDFDAMFVDRM